MNEIDNNQPIVKIEDTELMNKYMHRYEYKLLTRLFIEHKYERAVKEYYEKMKNKR